MTTIWTYERGEGRIKHCWNNSEAGFRPSRRGPVGKCSNTITDTVAQTLLSGGIELEIEDPAEEDDVCEDDAVAYPSEIYNVHAGTVYVAVPTRPGESYHGYPFQGRLPRRLFNQLKEKAEKDGCLTEFNKWTKKYLTT